MLVNIWESAAHWPVGVSPSFLKLFNLTVGHHAGLMHELGTHWVPTETEVGNYGSWSADALWGSKLGTATSFMSSSNCSSLNDRESYARALGASGLDIHHYGRCLRNRHRPPLPNMPRATSKFQEKLQALGAYKFTLAFENANCPYWITEKAFQPLAAGSVPVYMGAPNIRKFVPNASGYIFVDDFRSPAALAAHLERVSRSRELYLQYHAWRNYPLNPGFLRWRSAKLQGSTKASPAKLICSLPDRMGWT